MLKTVKEHIKENKYIYLTTLIALIIISIIFYLQKVTPFGENSTLTIDFYHQYGPMLSELRDRLVNGKNLLYSFNMSLGLPLFRNFLNYLSSPFNIILLFFSHQHILTAFSFIIGLKSVFAATTFCIFIKNKFHKNGIFLTILGLLFGFQAYFIAYYWNIMWLDGLVFLPLIILGIEKIVNENKNLLYIITLALMIFANYFIAYMICIFSILYFAAYLFIHHKKGELKKTLKTIVIFLTSSLLAGCLTAFLTLPLASSLSSTSATHDVIPFTRYYYFNPLEFIINHLTGISSTVFATDLTKAPNISFGIIAIPLLILFFTNPKINFKTKIGYTYLLLFLIFSFFIAPLDFIWHGFHVPNDLPYRFSFLYTFTLLTICSYSLIKLKEQKILFPIISYFATILLIIIIKFLPHLQITNKMLLINGIIVSIYFILYLISHFYPKTKKIMAFLFLIFISTECVIRVNNNWDIDQKVDNFYNDYDITETTLDFIRKNDDTPFYRLEKTNMLTFNDSSWYNYYGITSFSSMTYENLAKMQRDLGMPGNEINSFYYKPNTPVYDLMFNVKYILGNTLDNTHYDTILFNNTYTVYENLYNLNLMYGVNNSIKDWKLIENEPFTNQNNFIEKTTGIKNVFEPRDLTNVEEITSNDNITLIKYTFENDSTNSYFYTNDSNIAFFVINGVLYYKTSQYSDASIYFPMLNYYMSEEYSERKVVNFQDTKEQMEVYVGYNYYENNPLQVYHLNESNFKKAYNKLKLNELTITNFKENKIAALNNNSQEQTIYTSIPYDEGWKVTADGQEVKTFKISDTLLGFTLPKGSKNIELSYTPKGKTLGIIISLSALIIIIFTQIKKRKLN